MSIWDVLEKAAYTGLGLAALTKEKLDEALEKIKKERGFTEEEGRRFAKEIREHAEAARRKFDESVTAAVVKALPQLNLVKSEELEALRKRVVRLEKMPAKSGDGRKARDAGRK